MYTTSTYAAYASMNDAYAIAWSGFELTELHGAELVEFSVLSSSLIEQGPWMRGSELRFSTVLVDTNNNWDLAKGAFIAPVDGVYVLSVSSITSIIQPMELVRIILG